MKCYQMYKGEKIFNNFALPHIYLNINNAVAYTARIMKQDFYFLKNSGKQRLGRYWVFDALTNSCHFCPTL